MPELDQEPVDFTSPSGSYAANDDWEQLAHDAYPLPGASPPPGGPRDYGSAEKYTGSHMTLPQLIFQGQAADFAGASLPPSDPREGEQPKQDSATSTGPLFQPGDADSHIKGGMRQNKENVIKPLPSRDLGAPDHGPRTADLSSGRLERETSDQSKIDVESLARLRPEYKHTPFIQRLDGAVSAVSGDNSFIQTPDGVVSISDSYGTNLQFDSDSLALTTISATGRRSVEFPISQWRDRSGNVTSYYSDSVSVTTNSSEFRTPQTPMMTIQTASHSVSTFGQGAMPSSMTWLPRRSVR